MVGGKGTRQRIIIGSVVVMALVGVGAAALDWREAQRVITQADWTLVPIALFFTAVSYACLSYGFAVVNQIFGIRMAFRDLIEIGFVSITLNHLMAVGDLTGYYLRLLLMRRRGVVTGDILAASLFHSYFNNLAPLTLLLVGLVYFAASRPLGPGQAAAIDAGIAVLLLVISLATAVVFVTRMRTSLIRALASGWLRLSHHDIEASLRSFGDTLDRGVAVVRRRPAVALLPLGLIAADWAASILALGFCFDALGSPVGPGVLVTGFAIGVTAGSLSMVPGGLGVQEGGMSGAYTLLGVPFEQALLASILFRVVYYLIPFAISLSFYWRLLRETGAPG